MINLILSPLLLFKFYMSQLKCSSSKSYFENAIIIVYKNTKIFKNKKLIKSNLLLFFALLIFGGCEDSLRVKKEPHQNNSNSKKQQKSLSQLSFQDVFLTAVHHPLDQSSHSDDFTEILREDSQEIHSPITSQSSEPDIIIYLERKSDFPKVNEFEVLPVLVYSLILKFSSVQDRNHLSLAGKVFRELIPSFRRKLKWYSKDINQEVFSLLFDQKKGAFREVEELHATNTVKSLFIYFLSCQKA